ncbi:MAG TPA: pitrilysin family protein [Mesorhizobium sp.]|jgi:zinc protease|nr:pitrilysin family protein [Mesorhizobium sp.]
MRAILKPILLIVLFAAAAAAGPAGAVTIQEVVSPKGVRAWLVEDRSVPLVSMRFAFKGGSTQDPESKEGLATLMSSMFDEGAGALSSEAFQMAVDEAGAEMGFSAGPDAIHGGIRTLAETREKSFDLLRLAVNEPRFDAEPFERIRGQILAGLAAQANDPEAQAQRRWDEALWGDHPYARPEIGTEASLARISPADLQSFHAGQLARSNLIVGVVGAIDAETLKGELDRIFGDLPEKPELRPVGPAEPQLGQELRVAYDLPQATLRLAYPGVSRDDPDFFAAHLMVEILGGDGMASRLFTEVREKRGLSYGVGASLSTREHGDVLQIGTATSADKAGETLALIKDVVRRMAEEGPTAEELDAVKRFVTGAFAINNLGSSSGVAATLVDLQMQELGRDYMERRAAIIDAVTLEDVKRVARELLTAQPTVMVVGPETKAGP